MSVEQKLAGDVYRELRALWNDTYGGHRVAPRPAQAHEKLRQLLQDVGMVGEGLAISLRDAQKQRRTAEMKGRAED